MDEDTKDQPPKANGKDNGHVVSFPDAKERERIRQEREDIEKAKKTSEKIWQKAYRNQNKGEKVPFFTDHAKQIPPFTKYTVLGFFAIHLVTLLLSPEQYEWMVLNFSLIPARYTTDIMPWSITALAAPVTSLYLHGSFMHLALNSFMMLIMGMFFETSFGARRSLIFFLFCGLCGNLLFFLINMGQMAPVLGASGAIDGFFAVFLVINWSRLPVPPHLRKRGYTSILLFWCALTLVMGLFFPGTAWEAHLGGLLAGWGTLELWKRGKIKV